MFGELLHRGQKITISFSSVLHKQHASGNLASTLSSVHGSDHSNDSQNRVVFVLELYATPRGSKEAQEISNDLVIEQSFVPTVEIATTRRIV